MTKKTSPREVKSRFFSFLKVMLLTGFLTGFLNTTSAQVRPLISSFTSTQRTQLCSLMQVYITPAIIRQHCDYIALTGNPSLDIHSDFDFLPFHRMYIERMEDWLILQGFPQYVPLPKWDPSTCTPTEFQVVDADCASTSCTIAPGSCSTPSSWCPGISLPAELSLPPVAGAGNDICDWAMNPTSPSSPNCCATGLSRQIEGNSTSNYHNSVHVAMSGIMGAFRSPGCPIFWLWHAWVDDLWKSWDQNCSSSTQIPMDLYSKDNHFTMEEVRDRGEEPDIDPGPMWTTQDIWCKNVVNSGFSSDVHVDPIASSSPTYVYVRIRNRGYTASNGTETVELRWAKAATSLAWPSYWNGSVDLDPGAPVLPSGGLIGTMTIPVIAPGDQVILQFAWTAPNPSDYNAFNTEPWHFCLLSRILAASEGDPMTFTEGTSVGANVKNNNNIVWKNVNVIDNIPGIIAPGGSCYADAMESLGEAVAMNNPFDDDKAFDLVFTVPKEDRPSPIEIDQDMTMETFDDPVTFHVSSDDFENPGNPVTTDGTVLAVLQDDLYDKWVDGGSAGEGITELSEGDYRNPLNRKMFEITGPDAYFGNIVLEPGEYYTASLMVLYPQNPVSEKTDYKYDIIQRETDNTDEVIGGVRFNVTRPTCGDPVDAGHDVTIDRGCQTTLVAGPDVPCAMFTWTDNVGRVLGTARVLDVAPTTGTTYTVKMVSPAGCMSEDKVKVGVTSQPCQGTNGQITGVAPNPADDYVTVQYTLGGAQTAKLLLMKLDNSVNQSYDINPASQEMNIDVNDFSSGYYFLILICDGVNVDSEALIIAE